MPIRPPLGDQHLPELSRHAEPSPREQPLLPPASRSSASEHLCLARRAGVSASARRTTALDERQASRPPLVLPREWGMPLEPPPSGRLHPLDPISDLAGRFSGLYADWDEAVAELAERQARRGCELATEAGLLARPLAASGKPAATILRTASENDACAIVLGSGAHTRLGSAFASVVTRVVHGADRPVLVVPAAKQPGSQPARA
jgi:nucleotide-binding universal stress UspA family protein